MDKTKIKLLSLIPSEIFYIILLLTQIGKFYKITIRNNSVHSLTHVVVYLKSKTPNISLRHTVVKTYFSYTYKFPSTDFNLCLVKCWEFTK